MQEVKLIVHNILNHEEPPKSGYYLLFHVTPNNGIWCDNWWWDSENHAWKISETDDELYVVEDFWGYLWAEEMPNIFG